MLVYAVRIVAKHHESLLQGAITIECDSLVEGLRAIGYLQRRYTRSPLSQEPAPDYSNIRFEIIYLK